MNGLAKTDIVTFLNLFNRNGYVLNFSTRDFDEFTINSIGTPLCSKYELSKGESLKAYLYEAPNDKVIQILDDLLRYYENNYEHEYTFGGDRLGLNNSGYNAEYASLYKKCREILDKVKRHEFLSNDCLERLKEKFSSEYISKQIEAMKAAQATNPTDAIGKAKELVESCCKTILDRYGETQTENLKTSQLAHKALERLGLTPSCIASDNSAAKSIKTILGSLGAIVTSLSEIRNMYGSGHGKTASFVELETRHANLAVNSCAAFVTFVWESYEKSQTCEGSQKKNS